METKSRWGIGLVAGITALLIQLAIGNRWVGRETFLAMLDNSVTRAVMIVLEPVLQPAWGSSPFADESGVRYLAIASLIQLVLTPLVIFLVVSLLLRGRQLTFFQGVLAGWSGAVLGAGLAAIPAAPVRARHEAVLRGMDGSWADLVNRDGAWLTLRALGDALQWGLWVGLIIGIVVGIAAMFGRKSALRDPAVLSADASALDERQRRRAVRKPLWIPGILAALVVVVVLLGAGNTWVGEEVGTRSFDGGDAQSAAFALLAPLTYPQWGGQGISGGLPPEVPVVAWLLILICTPLLTLVLVTGLMRRAGAAFLQGAVAGWAGTVLAAGLVGALAGPLIAANFIVEHSGDVPGEGYEKLTQPIFVEQITLTLDGAVLWGLYAGLLVALVTAIAGAIAKPRTSPEDELEPLDESITIMQPLDEAQQTDYQGEPPADTAQARHVADQPTEQPPADDSGQTEILRQDRDVPPPEDGSRG